MAKRLTLTFIAVFSAVFLGVWLASFGPARTPAAEPQSQVVKEPVSSSDPASGSQEDGYYIVDYNGRVSVIRAGEEVPEMIFDIFTRTLPEVDQRQLEEGVYVGSYEELTRRVEDYIS